MNNVCQLVVELPNKLTVKIYVKNFLIKKDYNL